MRPWSVKQWPIVDLKSSPHRFVMVYGAPGAGKTATAVAGLIRFSRQFENHDFALLAKTSHQTNRVILPEVRIVCHELGIPYRRRSPKEYRVGRNNFLFFDGNNITSTARIQGLNLTGIYVDEVYNIPEEMMWELDNRLRGSDNAKMVLTANPSLTWHWFRREWASRADEIDMVIHRLYLADNPRLSERYKQSIKDTSYGHWYINRVLVEDADPTGPVWPEYKPPVKLPFDSREATQWGLAVDPGNHSSSTHALLFGRFEGDWWIVGEWEHNHRKLGKLTHQEQVDKIAGWLVYHGAAPRFAVIDSADQAFRTALEQVIACRVDNADKRKELGIEQTYHFLANGRIRFTDNVPVAYSQLRGYRWDPDKDKMGIVATKKGHDHAMDALRYFAMRVRRRR